MVAWRCFITVHGELFVTMALMCMPPRLHAVCWDIRGRYIVKTSRLTRQAPGALFGSKTLKLCYYFIYDLKIKFGKNMVKNMNILYQILFLSLLLSIGI